MAWTALSFTYGSKLTSTKMTQLFDNFTAMGSGDSSAPRVARNALETYTAGSYCELLSITTGYTLATSYTKVKEIVLPRGGTITIQYAWSCVGSGSQSRVYRNGAAIGTEWSTTTTQASTYIESVGSWTVGDLLQVYLKSPNSAYQQYVTSLGLFVANPIIPVCTI